MSLDEVLKSDAYDSYSLFGKYHRLGGPAVIYRASKKIEYWVNGQRIEEWAIENNIDLPIATEEDWHLIKMKFGEPTEWEYFEYISCGISLKINPKEFTIQYFSD